MVKIQIETRSQSWKRDGETEDFAWSLPPDQPGRPLNPSQRPSRLYGTTDEVSFARFTPRSIGRSSIPARKTT
jgi:hypothetical protein